MHVKKGVSKPQVEAASRARKLSYSIYKDGCIVGRDIAGTPQAFIFDWKGEVVYDGTRWAGLEIALEATLDSAPDWLTGPRRFERVTEEAKKVRARKDLGGVAAILREKIQSSDPEEQEEAATLLGRLETFAKSCFERADRLILDGLPLKARDLWTRLARDFKGDEIGDKAARTRKEKSQDPAFKKELSAAAILGSMEKTAEAIPLLRRGEDLERWKKKNARPIARILSMSRVLEKKYSQTCVYLRARRLLDSLKIG
ncbi:MAG: hypothetical protein ACYS47_13240 [Planctomycetota bacterium]